MSDVKAEDCGIVVMALNASGDRCAYAPTMILPLLLIDTWYGARGSDKLRTSSMSWSYSEIRFTEGNATSVRPSGSRQAEVGRSSNSPDFNPIEQAFSKFKWVLKSAKQRSVSALWKTCGELIDEFTQQECINYFRHCGYRYTYP